MPEQNITPVPITETSTRFHHRYTLAAVFLVFLVVGEILMVTLYQLVPLQRYYLARYVWASVTYQKTLAVTFVEISDRGRITLASPPDASELEGRLVLSKQAIDRHRGPLYFTPRTFPTEYVYELLQSWVYQGRSPGQILDGVQHASLAVLLVFLCGGLYLDCSNNHKRRTGIIRRGPKLLDRDQFNRTLKSDGIGFYVQGRPSLRELLLAPRWRRGIVRLPFQIETSHILVVGATGTGKSQFLTQFMSEIQARGETAVVYDPDGEFLSEFYDDQRGDIVLNPLDKRCPYWAPAPEFAGNEEALTLAASIFPDPSKPEEKNTFFTRAPRQILARLFENDPTPQQLVTWLSSKDEIDKRIKGTEMQDMLSKSAGPQRSGILASLSMALNAFRLLPTLEECSSRRWSAREWAVTRQGWIFLTSQETTRDIQRPLISMWLDTILLRLMTRSPDGKPPKPVWLIMDELASLNKLPTLQAALTRGRKYQIKTLLGFQAQSQLQEIYGKEGAETLLANPSTRVFFRTDDPGTADWVSRSLGDQEIAREKINFTNQGGLHHRRSRTYTIEVKTERAVIASQISGLRNLHGYIRIYECIAAFTLRYVDRVANSVAFISRNTLGFVPIADLEPYQIIDSDSRQPQPATTPTPAAPRSAPQTIASGGGGAGITTQINPAVDDRDLVPFSPDATGSQQHTILQPGPRSKAATVAETAVGQHELRANIQSLHNRAAQGAQPSATKHNAQRQMLNQRPGVFLTPECSDPPPQRFATPDISGLVNALEAPLTGIASRGTLVQPAGEVAKEVRHQLQDAEQETHGLGV